MTFAKKKPEEKKFGGRETRTVSIKVPIDEYESIKTILNEFVDNFREDNPQRIETIQDGVKEIISVYLDVYDCLKYRTTKELLLIVRRSGDYSEDKVLTTSKYYTILKKHNLNLINDLLTKFPIKRSL